MAFTPIHISKSTLWCGRVLSALPILFLLMDAAFKFISPPPEPVVQACTQLGWPLSLNLPIGITLLLCVVLYAIPRTAMLGAILLTGYLGGAIAMHVRVQNPLFANVLFPLYIAIPLWLGLYLREPRLRALIPLRL